MKKGKKNVTIRLILLLLLNQPIGNNGIGEKERKRERQRERDRQIDRQRERETETERDYLNGSVNRGLSKMEIKV